MVDISEQQRRRAFGWWLRTGRLMPARQPDGVELKFNPWHDPDDGRFTSRGAGRHFGEGEGAAEGAPAPRTRRSGRQDAEAAGPAPARPLTPLPAGRGAGKGATSAAARSGERNAAVEFAIGTGEGLYDAAAGAERGVHSALTTNPVTTIRDTGRGIAAMIDTAVAAEDTPARVQVQRAADAVTNASPREIGHAVGSVAGNTVLAAAPGAGISKIAATRHLRTLRPRTVYDPPQIGWVKERLRVPPHVKQYNDGATGARR